MFTRKLNKLNVHSYTFNKFFSNTYKHFSNINTNISNQPLISPEDAYTNLKANKSLFIDVRSPSDYSTSHIPSSVNIHEIFTYLSMSDKSGKQDLINTFESLFRKAGIDSDSNTHVITYEDCLETLFGASCRGYYILKLLGHHNVQILNGGWHSWLNQGLPTTTEVPNITASNFKADFNNEIFYNKDDMMRAISSPNTVLVDVRDDVEWIGESSSPYGIDYVPRKGRIPGAVHLMWKDLMREDNNGMTIEKSNEEIVEICNKKGITNDKEIVVYCFKGARASNTFAMLKKAGFSNVKNYFASWNEWARNDELPIDGKKL